MSKVILHYSEVKERAQKILEMAFGAGMMIAIKESEVALWFAAATLAKELTADVLKGVGQTIEELAGLERFALSQGKPVTPVAVEKGKDA